MEQCLKCFRLCLAWAVFGGNLSRQIEVTGDEHDHIHEVGCTAITTGPVLGQLEESVDPFGGGIGGSGDRSHDAVPMLSHHTNESLQRLQAAEHCTATPVVEELLGPPDALILPEVIEAIF